jgi:DNA-binding MarR family transcriptional regulator
MSSIKRAFGVRSSSCCALRSSGSTESKELAAVLWCDASNVTGIIDRLEARGFVERRPSEHDRRVKCVVLTTAGKRLRRKLDERFNDSPPAISALSDADQRTLAEILGRALENAAKQRAARFD